MTFSVRITLDLEVEVDGAIPDGFDLTGKIETAVSDSVPPVLYEWEDVVNLFAKCWSVKVEEMRWNTK